MIHPMECFSTKNETRAGAPSRGERMKTQAMGDVFMERMVKKKFESTDALVLLGIIVAMVVVVFIGFIVGFVLMPMPMITFWW